MVLFIRPQFGYFSRYSAFQGTLQSSPKFKSACVKGVEQRDAKRVCEVVAGDGESNLVLFQVGDFSTQHFVVHLSFIACRANSGLIRREQDSI
jgi:hypothetical protein